MAEATEVKRARQTVEAREAGYVQAQISAGKQLRDGAAAAQSQEERQGQQNVASSKVRSRHEEAVAQGEGA